MHARPPGGPPPWSPHPPYRQGGAWGPPPPPIRGSAGGSALAVLTVLKWGALLLFGVPCLGIVAYVIVQFEREKSRDLLVFDNRTKESCEVLVDGTKIVSLGSLGAWDSSREAALPAGASKVRVSCSGGTQVEHTLALPPRAPGQKRGYRGLFVVEPAGQKTAYVIAKLPYYQREPKNPEPPKITYLPSSKPLIPLPSELESYEMAPINGGFLESDTSYSGGGVTWRTHICTLKRDGNIGRVGCSGFPDIDL